MLYVGRGVRNLEVVDEKWLERKYGVRGGPAYADLATLRGDPSDGLPGVPGVGEKTAAGLLSKFPDLQAVRAAAAAGDPRIAPGLAKKLAAAEDYLDAAGVVVRVVRDAPVPDLADDAAGRARRRTGPGRAGRPLGRPVQRQPGARRPPGLTSGTGPAEAG